MGLFGSDSEMTLTLEKYSFIPGETINGSVGLDLKKPVKGRKLEVELIGTMKRGPKLELAVNIGAANTRHRDRDRINNQTETVYSLKLPLDGEKEYQKGNYPFEIKIQQDILQSNLASSQISQSLEENLGVIGSVLGQAVTGLRPVQWRVQARIDIPMGFDVNQSRDIVISPAEMQYKKI